jgi:acetolactate synthase-1/2/3 large subunit
MICVRLISTHAALAGALDEKLHGAGPQFCEVVIDPAQNFAPKLSSRKRDDGRMVASPLHDMAPFLPRGELAENMWEEKHDA